MARSITLPPDQAAPGTQSIGRAVHLLRCIASNGRRGLRIGDIVQTSGLSKTTAVRVLRRLVAEGLVERDNRTEKFYLGRVLAELGLLAQPRNYVEELCEDAMAQLADLTHDTVYLSERRGHEAVCTARRLGSHPIKVLTWDVGVRRPLGVAPGGVALLAAMQPDEREATIAALAPVYQGYGGLTAQRVRKQVTGTVARGFYAGPSFGVRGVRSVSMGFVVGGTVAAISVTAIASRLTARRQEQVVRLLARHITAVVAVPAVAATGSPIPARASWIGRSAMSAR